MNNNLQRDVQILNDLPLTDYLHLLGYQPTVIRFSSADYEVCIDDTPAVTITIDYATNRFTDRANNRRGGLVYLVCLLYRITVAQLCANIVPYQLDRLMTQQMIRCRA